MASVESVTIKVELETCHGCLSSDRRLIALSENTDLFLCLLGRDYVEDPTSISLCWECSAILRNTRRFQQRIQIAQDIMRHSLNQEEHFCLSTLATKTETYCNTVSYVNLNNEDQEIDTRCEGISHQDMLKKQPAVKLGPIEVKCEYDYDFYTDDVDMESVLREKEEYLNYITLNRACSPSSTRDSSITVYPLVKSSKSHDDNEIKTEGKTTVTNTEHVETATESQVRPVSCEVCDKIFDGLEQLQQHVTIHTGDKPYRCEICGKSFRLKGHLNDHLRIHTGDKPYSCEVCGQRFIQQGGLKRHLRAHTGEKLHSCEICDKAFQRNDSLKQHLRTHTGEKPYNCEICDKRFNGHGQLKQHIRTHTGEKPYSCEICDKRFNKKATLRSHLRIHTGDKPYSCEICDKRFRIQGNLKLHLRTHADDKPYSCEICDKRFKRKRALKVHLRSHAGEKPYSCEVCNKGFTRKIYLVTHLKIHTDEKP